MIRTTHNGTLLHQERNTNNMYVKIPTINTGYLLGLETTMQ